jgi:hypothetical protein
MKEIATESTSLRAHVEANLRVFLAALEQTHRFVLLHSGKPAMFFSLHWSKHIGLPLRNDVDSLNPPYL